MIGLEGVFVHKTMLSISQEIDRWSFRRCQCICGTFLDFSLHM